MQKLALSENFTACSDVMKASMNKWLREMFGDIEDNQPIFNREPFQPLPVVHPVEKPREIKKPRIKSGRKEKLEYEHDGVNYSTLGELLDHMEGAFNSMRFSVDKRSWIRKEDIAAIKKIGVYVPSPWLFDCSKRKVESTQDMPSIMAVSFADKTEDAPDRCSPKIAFAIRQKKLPANVEQVSGVPYIFGQSYIFNNKSFWVGMYIVIKHDGTIHLCKEVEYQQKQIIHKKKSWAGRVTTVSQKVQRESSLLYDEERSVEYMRELEVALFANIFDWWSRRDERWNVGVRKDDSRVTFCVEQENTKLYFADRDKSIKAIDGKAKRIIHYVREHERVTEKGTQIVKEHIRGIREFDWNGHHCIINAPKFHHSMVCKFGIEPEEFDEGERIPKKYISTSVLADMISNMEDYGISTPLNLQGTKK